MKRLFVAAVLVAALFEACQSNPTPDPNNGVSMASQRAALVRAETNVASVTSRMIRSRDEDLSTDVTLVGPNGASGARSPAHSKEWWDSQITELQVTRDLIHAALTGETK